MGCPGYFGTWHLRMDIVSNDMVNYYALDSVADLHTLSTVH